QSSRWAKRVKMVKLEGTRIKQQARSARRSPAAACFICFACPFLVLLTGCSTLNTKSDGNAVDPLFGGAPKRTAEATLPAAAPVTALPLPTAPGSGISNAALASVVPRQFDRDSDLRIGNPSGSTGSEGWAKQEPLARADGTGVLLRAPQ